MRAYEHPQLPGMGERLVLAGLAIAIFGTHFWPGREVLAVGLSALGNPPYEGVRGIFLPHLLLYSTVPAIIAGLLWWILVQGRSLPAPQFRRLGPALVAGVAGGFVALCLTLLVVWESMPAGTIHWIPPSPWKIAGNLFSNFYEEFVFRGFILAALRRATGFWPAAVLSSAMWALLHSQYPVAVQAVIFVTGIGLCWLVRETRSLWTPYVAHMVLDVTADSLIG